MFSNLDLPKLLFGRLTLDAIPYHEPILVVTMSVVLLGGLALFGALTYFKLWGYLWKEWFTTVDHKKIGIMYMILGLVMLLRGFAEARSGEEITTATVSEILDMAATAGPSSVEERRRSVRAAGRPLDINPLGHVGELLAVWEQPSFDREPQAAAQEALTHAREVVTRW